jgi:hypothetical protein
LLYHARPCGSFTLLVVRKRLCSLFVGSTLIPPQQDAAATQESNMSDQAKHLGYQEFPNLVGVFKAKLPIAVAQVSGQDGKTIRVTYYDHDYIVAGKPVDGSSYAYRVFQVPAN